MFRHTIPALLFAATGLGQGGFTYEPVVQGLTAQCTAFAALPDGRVLICERLTGNVRVAIGGTLQATPWWSVGYTSSPMGESGLLAIVADPAFLTNRRVYACYTDHVANLTKIVRIDEVGGAGTNETVIHTLPKAANTHLAGPLVFGADGYLYALTGDNDGSPAPSPIWSDPRGKVLRMDTDGTAAPGNPVAGVATFAAGLRNGYGLCVHPTLGAIFQTENGQGPDELNLIQFGADYGWPVVEGFAGNALYADPQVEWPVSTVPTGIAVANPEVTWSGYGGDLFVLEWNATITRFPMSGVQIIGPQAIWQTNPGIQMFAIANGPDGHLWVLSGANWAGFEIGRYVANTAPNPRLAIAPVSGPSIGGSATVGLTASAGNLVVSWIALSLLTPSVPSPWGLIEVPPHALFPAAIADQLGNAFHALAIPAIASLAGLPIHVQGLAFDPLTGTGIATGRATHAIR